MSPIYPINNHIMNTRLVTILTLLLTKPYTSVFFQLECGYWNADAEKRMRDAMKAAE